jgi:hypothetical protein
LRLPTPSNAVIAPRDALLLKGAFHGLEKTPLIASFFKQLARVYGEFIPYESLRHAILACTAVELLPENEGLETMEYHKMRASSCIRKLISNGAIQDADVFAAFLLAWATYGDSNGLSESLVHARGCGAMMRHVSATGADTTFLQIFRGLLWDKISWMILTADSSQLASSTPFSSFGNRVRYYEQLCITGTPVWAWKSAPLEAVHDYLCDLLRTSLVWFHDIAIAESGCTLGIATVPVGIANYIRERISDFELKNVLFNTLSKDNRSIIPDGDKQIIQLQFAQLKTINLLRRIFESPTILEGIDTAQTMFIAERLLCDMQTQPRLSPPLTDYYQDYSLIGIALAGLTLLKDVTQRNSFSVIR